MQSVGVYSRKQSCFARDQSWVRASCERERFCLCSMEQVQALRSMEDPDKSLPFIREILTNLRSEVGNASTVLGFVGAPWTLAAYSMESGHNK